MECNAVSPIRHRARAFTLVELLVVIGIIALLISILLPALNKARQHAITAQCLSNLHQMGLGLTLYQMDSHGLYPPENQGNGDWMVCLAKYINPTFKNPYDPTYASSFPMPPSSFTQQVAMTASMPKVWFCPQAPLSNAIASGPGSAAGSWGGTTIPWGPGTYDDLYYISGSYTINGWIYNLPYSTQFGGVPAPVQWSGINTYSGVTASNWANYFVNSHYPYQAANTPSFCDSSWHDAWPVDFANPSVVDAPPSAAGEVKGAQYNTAVPAVGTDQSMMCRVALARHGKAINVVFLDGHAATIPLSQLWSLQWSPMSARLPSPTPVP